eukprot:scaffold257898_cov31-Tisochrysis_lutea.AAC.3
MAAAREPRSSAVACLRSFRLLRVLLGLRPARWVFTLAAVVDAAFSARSCSIATFALSFCPTIMLGPAASAAARRATRPSRCARSNLRAATWPLICA